MLCWLGLVWS